MRKQASSKNRKKKTKEKCFLANGIRYIRAEPPYPGVVAPDDVDVIVAHLTLLSDLLRIAPLRFHLCHHMEDHFERRSAKICGSVVTSEACVNSAKEALMF